jgi:hypothetical protein
MRNAPHMDIQEPITEAQARQLNRHAGLFLCTFGNCDNGIYAS